MMDNLTLTFKKLNQHQSKTQAYFSWHLVHILELQLNTKLQMATSIIENHNTLFN